MAKSVLSADRFHNEEAAFEYVETQLWPHGPTCPHCGVRQPELGGQSEKRLLPAVLLCFFFGVFGAHRFYIGRIGSAVVQLLTIGGLGIWWLVDLILLATGSLKDGAGQKITEW